MERNKSDTVLLKACIPIAIVSYLFTLNLVIISSKENDNCLLHKLQILLVNVQE